MMTMRRDAIMGLLLAAGLLAACYRSSREDARTAASPEATPPVAVGEASTPPSDRTVHPGRGAEGAGAPSAAREEPAREEAADRDAEVREQEQRTIPSYHAVTLPEGTVLPIVMRTPLSSETSRVEERVTAEVSEDVRIGGRVVVPAGSELRGHVTAAKESGRVKGRARLAVQFDRLVVNGRSYPIETTGIDVTAPETHKRDAAIIGGSTAVGAIVGALGGHAKRGAIVGAGAGTAAVLITKGHEVEIPEGSRWRVRVRETARL